MSDKFLPILFALMMVIVLNPISAFATSNDVIDHVSTKQKVVALTFDADMNPKMLHKLQKHKVESWYNKRVIDELVAGKVPATLFLTGMWVEAYSTTTAELAANPLFEIGNHSYSHPAFSSSCYKLATTTESDDTYQVTNTDQLLTKYAPNHSMIFRFPGLCYDADDLKAVAQSKYTVIGGDVLGDDGFQTDTSKIVSNVVDHVHPGSIVVLHMMGGPNAPKTADALRLIILSLKKEGYKFVTVSNLLNLRAKK